MSKDKEEAAARQQDRKGSVTIKSNPICICWVTHKLENNNTKEVFPLLWKFWIPSQASQPGDNTKGLGIPRESGLEGQWDLIIGLPEDWGKQKFQSWKAQPKFCMHQDPEERSSDPTGDWAKATCWCWRASCRDVSWYGLTTGMGALGGPLWHKPSWNSPLILSYSL